MDSFIARAAASVNAVRSTYILYVHELPASSHRTRHQWPSTRGITSFCSNPTAKNRRKKDSSALCGLRKRPADKGLPCTSAVVNAGQDVIGLHVIIVKKNQKVASMGLRSLRVQTACARECWFCLSRDAFGMQEWRKNPIHTAVTEKGRRRESLERRGGDYRVKPLHGREERRVGTGEPSRTGMSRRADGPASCRSQL